MKKLLLSSLSLFAVANSFAQYNTVWPNNVVATSNVSNTTSAGYVGLGIKSTATATTLPGFNFQVHGTADYSISIINPFPLPPSNVNYGKTARIGLTNSTTGLSSTDGGVLRMSDNTFTIENLENKVLELKSNSSLLTFHGDHGKIYAGSFVNYAIGNSELNKLGYFNIQGSNNGLFIQTNIVGKYGVSIQMKGDTDNAINVYSNNNTTQANFRVKGDGKVYATEVNVMLASTPFPDYVFESTYHLKSLNEIENHIKTFGRLPNMPSANQVSKGGLNLGEISFILVEKIEELTLYLIEQQKVIDALNAKVSKLEQNQNK